MKTATAAPLADATAAFVDEHLARALRPEPMLTVSAWADEFRKLSSKESSEPGSWRTSRTPYLRAIMDALSARSPVEEVIFLAGSQVGKTECGNNWIGYVIARAPGPMLAVSPTLDMAKRFSRQRVDTMIETTPVLRGQVAERRERDGGNTRLWKDFAGGALVLTGANSAVGLRSVPVRYVFLDEVDAYPPSAGDEGDPILLARRRTATFQRRKLFLCSTPKRAGTSRIVRAFDGCEAAFRFDVACPHCGQFQELVWDRMRWPPLADGAAIPDVIPDTRYCCVACEALIAEHEKTRMLAAGRWTALWNRGTKSVGFRLSALYSPVGWFSWGEAAAMHEKAKHNPEMAQVFQNTVLGLPYVEEHDAPDWHRLYERREPYALGIVPAGVRFLTAGVDVQRRRLEVEVVGWGRGKQSWSIAYEVIEADTATDEPWDALEALLMRDWPCVGDGALPIWLMAVDSGAYSQVVYKWVRRFSQPWVGPAGIKIIRPRSVAAIKGRDWWDGIVITPRRSDATDRRRSVKVFQVGTSAAKTELYQWLRLDAPTDGKAYPPGYCHHPEYTEDYFRQLTSERMVLHTTHQGFQVLRWEKDPGAHNEALDARVYARWAASACRLDAIDAAGDREWKRIELALPPTLLEVGAAPEDEPPPDRPPPATRPPAPPHNPRQPRVLRSSWMRRFSR